MKKIMIMNTYPSQQGMSGQHRADSDTMWERRITLGPTLARFFMLAGIPFLWMKNLQWLYTNLVKCLHKEGLRLRKHH